LKPFLKWAGGKYRIVHRIREQLPPGHRLVEPFVGSGAVFLNLDYPGYLLCDNNADLINLFQVLKEEGETFVKYCRDYFTPASNREEEYYRFRSEFNRTGNKKQKAALFLYLNRHGYNGLCRYNSSGEFNTPFGRYVKPYFPKKRCYISPGKPKRPPLPAGISVIPWLKRSPGMRSTATHPTSPFPEPPILRNTAAVVLV